jgi:cytochrome d ubiquinol oxidase subunit II
MALHDVPMVFILLGAALYVVLGGADFGAGIWQLAGGPKEREHAHHAMAPVWEANHVWLIFVLTVMWTAYPSALGSIASTLSIALAVAGLGIIMRGFAYALRSATASAREQRRVDAISGVSSLLTPFALGAAVGGIASRRVPVGNARGDLWSSWLNPTSIAIGLIAVCSAAYLAAVYLSADAVRHDAPELAQRFRRRALVSGVLAGALAVAGLVVVHGDARPLWHGLTAGAGLPALIVSAVAGAGTLALVAARRYEPARYSAALAVAAVVAGWALAQKPLILPGLTIAQAAASRQTLVAVVVAVVAGGVILFPSLALLFRLTLGGRLGEGAGDAVSPADAPGSPLAVRPSLARAAAALFVIGFGFLTVLDAGWAHAIGVAAFFAFLCTGFLAALPRL